MLSDIGEHQLGPQYQNNLRVTLHSYSNNTLSTLHLASGLRGHPAGWVKIMFSQHLDPPAGVFFWSIAALSLALSFQQGPILIQSLLSIFCCVVLVYYLQWCFLWLVFPVPLPSRMIMSVFPYVFIVTMVLHCCVACQSSHVRWWSRTDDVASVWLFCYCCPILGFDQSSCVVMRRIRAVSCLGFLFVLCS